MLHRNPTWTSSPARSSSKRSLWTQPSLTRKSRANSSPSTLLSSSPQTGNWMLPGAEMLAMGRTSNLLWAPSEALKIKKLEKQTNRTRAIVIKGQKRLEGPLTLDSLNRAWLSSEIMWVIRKILRITTKRGSKDSGVISLERERTQFKW